MCLYGLLMIACEKVNVRYIIWSLWGNVHKSERNIWAVITKSRRYTTCRETVVFLCTQRKDKPCKNLSRWSIQFCSLLQQQKHFHLCSSLAISPSCLFHVRYTLPPSLSLSLLDCANKTQLCAFYFSTFSDEVILMITSILAPSKPASHSAHHNSRFNKQNNYTCASGAQQGSGLRGEHKKS